MFGYIYKTTNLLDSKVYIGQKQGNFNPNYFGSGLYLKNAIKKYGKDHFVLEVIIHVSDKQKLDELEKQYIKEYREILGKDKVYNITDGGEGFFGEFLPEHCKNISLSRMERKEKLGYINSPETKKKIGLAHIGNTYRRGKIHTKEANEKNRIAHLGKKDTPEVKEKKRQAKLGGRNHFFGKIHTQESLSKIRNNAKDRIWVNRNNETKLVKKTELPIFLNNEWKYGRKRRNKNG